MTPEYLAQPLTPFPLQQVHHALSKDDKLDVFAFESITSARRWRSAQKLEEE